MNIGQDIMELYQALILDHNKNPKNFRKIETPTVSIEGHNPLCGDHYHIYLSIDSNNNIISDISFEGHGCAISKASASLMTSLLKGATIEKANTLFEEFHLLLIGKLDPQKEDNQLGKLKVFSGIWKYPSRVKCASLSWHSMKAALDGKDQTIKTE